MSGVSIRTLRLYDEMGLVRPARLQNGYRTYSSSDLDALQQVVLYRSCGMELSKIAQVLQEPSFDRKAALREHLTNLESRRRELDKTIAMLERTIGFLEGEATMSDEEKFAGLKQVTITENEKRHGLEARERWGDEVIDTSNKRIADMSKETWNMREELDQHIIDILARAVKDGVLDDGAAKELASLHTEWLTMQWGEGRYSSEVHKAIAKMYLQDGRFTDHYDSKAGAGATELLARAIAENV